MDRNPDKIYILTLKEIAGTLSPKDKEFLYEVISEDENAFRCWQELHQTLGYEQLQEAHKSMQRHSTQEIIIEANKRRRRFTLKATFIVASLLIAACCSTYVFLINQQPSHTHIMAATVLFNKKDLQLITSNGKIINLPESDSTIQTTDVSLNYIDHTLHFNARGQRPDLYTLNVPYGKDYTIVLPDGTKVSLNAGTVITFPLSFTGNSREIGIDGEAYLEIAPKAQQPFIVYLPSSQVKVLGTSFNVNTYDSAIKIALVEGSIKVQQGKHEILVAPGNEVTSTPGKPLQTRPFNPNTVLSWRTGIHEFGQNATQLDLFRLLPRWYGVEIQLEDTALLKQKPFIGSMDRGQPLQMLLSDLQTVDSTFQYYFDDKKILHIQ